MNSRSLLSILVISLVVVGQVAASGPAEQKPKKSLFVHPWRPAIIGMLIGAHVNNMPIPSKTKLPVSTVVSVAANCVIDSKYGIAPEESFKERFCWYVLMSSLNEVQSALVKKTLQFIVNQPAVNAPVEWIHDQCSEKDSRIFRSMIIMNGAVDIYQYKNVFLYRDELFREWLKATNEFPDTESERIEPILDSDPQIRAGNEKWTVGFLPQVLLGKLINRFSDPVKDRLCSSIAKKLSSTKSQDEAGASHAG